MAELPGDKQTIKVCARCKAWFDDDMLFETCPACRHPLINDGGGCHYWWGVKDPRVDANQQVIQLKQIKEMLEGTK